MKILKFVLLVIANMCLYGCRPQVGVISVANMISEDTIKVEFQFYSELIPQDSTLIIYNEGFLGWPLKKFPDYDLTYYNFPILSDRITINMPTYLSKTIVRENVLSCICPPYSFFKCRYAKFKRKDIKNIIKKIHRITIYANNDSVTYSTPILINQILNNSEYKKGNICIQVDSAMFNNHRGL